MAANGNPRQSTTFTASQIQVSIRPVKQKQPEPEMFQPVAIERNSAVIAAELEQAEGSLAGIQPTLDSAVADLSEEQQKYDVALEAFGSGETETEPVAAGLHIAVTRAEGLKRSHGRLSERTKKLREEFAAVKLAEDIAVAQARMPELEAQVRQAIARFEQHAIAARAAEDNVANLLFDRSKLGAKWPTSEMKLEAARLRARLKTEALTIAKANHIVCSVIFATADGEFMGNAEEWCLENTVRQRQGR
jgi:chromosome segregation ATPase